MPRNSDFPDDEEAHVGEDDEELEDESTPIPSSNMSDLGEITPGGSQVTQKQQIHDEVTPLLNAPDRSSIRRNSSAALKEPYNYGGRSTYKQTVGYLVLLDC